MKLIKCRHDSIVLNFFLLQQQPVFALPSRLINNQCTCKGQIKSFKGYTIKELKACCSY